MLDSEEKKYLLLACIFFSLHFSLNIHEEKQCLQFQKNCIKQKYLHFLKIEVLTVSLLFACFVFKIHSNKKKQKHRILPEEPETTGEYKTQYKR